MSSDLSKFFTTSTAPESTATAPTLEQLVESAARWQAARPPRYRVHRDGLLCQFVADGSKMYMTQGTRDALAKTYPPPVVPKAPLPYSALSYSGFSVHILSQAQLERMAAWLASHGTLAGFIL